MGFSSDTPSQKVQFPFNQPEGIPNGMSVNLLEVGLDASAKL